MAGMLQNLELELQYKSCYARVLDSKRRFLEAATRYYELSQTGAREVGGQMVSCPPLQACLDIETWRVRLHTVCQPCLPSRSNEDLLPHLQSHQAWPVHHLAKAHTFDAHQCVASSPWRRALISQALHATAACCTLALQASTRSQLRPPELNQASGMQISEEDLTQALNAAVTCCILASAGPQRSRVLANLYKDERCARLPLFPFLQKVFLDRILTRGEVGSPIPRVPFQSTGIIDWSTSIPAHSLHLTILVMCTCKRLARSQKLTWTCCSRTSEPPPPVPTPGVKQAVAGIRHKQLPHLQLRHTSLLRQASAPYAGGRVCGHAEAAPEGHHL